MGKMSGEPKQAKKYGLVWEDKPERIVERCANESPILREVKRKAIETARGEPTHLLIEGDNYHALSALMRAHRRSVDVIYIDPPYNTGKREFKYNDRWVDEGDSYRHSKWLSFMNRRLRLARELLKDDGVIFISIDDNEMARLRLLCDEIFGERNFVNNFMWLHGKGKKNKQSRTLQQYVLCYAKKRRLLGAWVDTKPVSGALANPDNDERGAWFSGSISFAESRSNQAHANYFTIKSPSGIEWTRQWQCSRREMAGYLRDKRIYFGAAPKYANVPRLKKFPAHRERVIPDNILRNVGTTRGAQKDLDEMLGKARDGSSRFDNPKPMELIEQLLRIVNKGDTICVLDFFAGSGTTAHAVLSSNARDGGARRFIVCTNNEKGICEQVCYARIRKAMRGYRTAKKTPVNGLGGNLRYYKAAFAGAGQRGSAARASTKV